MAVLNNGGVLPPNFAWVVDGFMAALAYPWEETHFQYLVDEGITHLVSLTEEPPPMNPKCGNSACLN